MEWGFLAMRLMMRLVLHEGYRGRGSRWSGFPAAPQFGHRSPTTPPQIGSCIPRRCKKRKYQRLNLCCTSALTRSYFAK